MATLLKANVVTSGGARFTAPVANLTPTGMFLRTTESLQFRDKLTVSVLGFSIPGEVLFVSVEPPGVVISIAAPFEARNTLEVRSRTVVVLEAPKPAHSWEEDTAAEPGSVAVDDLALDQVPAVTDAVGPADPLEVPDLPLSVTDEDEDEKEPATVSTALAAISDDPDPSADVDLAIEAPIEESGELADAAAAAAAEADVHPSLLAMAELDDSADLMIEPAQVTAPTPVALPVFAAPVVAPPPVVVAPPVVAAPPPPVVVAPPVVAVKAKGPVLIPDPPLPAPMPRAASTSQPPMVLIPDPPKVNAIPSAPPAPAAAASSSPPAPAGGSEEPLRTAPSRTESIVPIVDPSLPDLEGDVVKFISKEHFATQFRSNLMHGGLVVRARVVPIGTQRLLALAVPGFDNYTVSARVVFSEPGKLGFMLDSFNLHKTRLQQMAEQSSRASA